MLGHGLPRAKKKTAHYVSGRAPDDWASLPLNPHAEAYLATIKQPILRGRIRAALARPMRLNGYGLQIRADHAVNLVECGYRIKTCDNGKRRLLPSGGGWFFDEKDVTSAMINLFYFILISKAVAA